MDGGEALGDTPARDVDDTMSNMEFFNVGDSLPPQRRKRRGSAGRRVSFAEITKVHVFKRDDEYETPPETQTEDTTTTFNGGRRRSPRLADKVKRNDSLEEARVALAPRFDVATPSVAAGVSPSGTNEQWVLHRETPDSDGVEMELEHTGPVDFRRLRDDDIEDDDDVTGDTPLFSDLLKADRTATLISDQPEFTRGEGNTLSFPPSELEMSLTDIPSKWPIQRPNFAIEDSQDSDMSLSSEFPMKEMLQATPQEVSSRHNNLVEVPVVSSPEYDQVMQARDSTDMELVTSTFIGQLPYDQGNKAGKRKTDDTYAKKIGRRSTSKGQKLVLTSSKNAVKIDKENLPPEFLVPARSANKKGGVTKVRTPLSQKKKPENLNATEQLEAGSKDVTLDRIEITMAIPRLSDLLKADEAEGEVSDPVEPLSGMHGSGTDCCHAGKTASPITDSAVTNSADSAVLSCHSREAEGNSLREHVMKIARLLQIVKESNIRREQQLAGAAEIAVLQFTEKPKSLAESLRFSHLSKPQMQILEARLTQLQLALAHMKSGNSEMSHPISFTGLHVESTKELEPDVLNLECTARNFVSKQFQGQDKVLQSLHDNKRILEKEMQILSGARESQKEVQELAKDLQSTIGSTAVSVHKACCASRVAGHDSKHSRILQEIQYEEKTLDLRNSRLVELRSSRKLIHEKVEQTKSELNPQTSQEAALKEDVGALTKKQEFFNKALRLQVKTCITGQQVLEVMYLNLISQRFVQGQREQLVMCSSLLYQPEDIDKVFPDLNASKLFLGLLPPHEDKVIGAAKNIPESVQKTERTVWKLVKLMEELQECKYRKLFYLTSPKIIGSNATGFEVSLKFIELRKVVRFSVTLEIEVGSLSLNGQCKVQVEYVSKAAQSCVSEENIIKTITAVQPGYWRISRICDAVQLLLDNLRKSV